MKGLILGIWLGLVGVFVSLTPGTINADIPVDSNCPDITTSLNILTKLPSGNYNIYAKIAPDLRSQQLIIYEQNSKGYCRELVNKAGFSNNWNLINKNFIVGEEEVSLMATVGNLSFGQEPGSGPMDMMFVPTDTKVEFINDQPSTTIDNDSATIIPRSGYRQDGNIRINYFENLKVEDIRTVNYIIDGRVAYSTRADIHDDTYRYLTRYLNSKELKKEIIFKSGDKAVITSIFQVEQPTFYAYLVWIFRQIPPVIFVLLSTAVLMILSSIVLGVASIIYKKRMWAINHGYAKGNNVLNEPTQKLLGKINRATAMLRKLIIVVVGVILVTVLVLGNIVDVFKVDGPSMQNTLEDNQRLVVIKASTKLHELFTGRPYAPRRGDVVIINLFDYKTNWFSRTVSFQEHNTIVKRVIGLPGETVVVHGDEVMVKTVEGQVLHPDSGAPWDSTRIIEYRLQDLTVTLGSDEVFVLGDNRPESIDSRYLGPIKIDKLIGEALSD